MRFSQLCLGVALTAGCQPNTGRPAFAPLPESAGTEIRLSVREATRRLADALRADSVPVRKVLLRDGYVESGWFDARTTRPTTKRNPIGPGIVRIRAWADPARPGSSQLAVETSYRVMADPSLPERELERQVPPKHPVATKVDALLRQLVQRFGGPPPPQTQPPTARPGAAGDQ